MNLSSGPRRDEEVIESCALFRGLDADQRSVMTSMAVRQRFKQGAQIFMQEQPCPGIYIVDHGLVRVFRLAPNGQQHVLHLCGPNQTFAEVAAIGGFALPACAVTTQPTGCVMIPTDRLQQELAENHDLCRQLLTGMAFWVRHFVQLLEDIALRDAMGRVTRLLCDTPCNPSGLLRLPGAKKDLANHLNLTSETFSRVLRRLCEQGILEFNSNRSIRVIDAAGLERLARE
ncbi:Crp/Fnr family transcriptional regulator [Novipirellula artificiosorum]|uniref:cAMP receptor protein n=1 Tax=Novipirellula artificiosorum TaxID=2528016 RepID=A0A5C6DZU4_9BACT|nr:Crp/Fnr family transcriptional regulator [Novipirellula artificiosorum]TWU41975.1 cAMP receptor protein [Novipirellula artificiosorum]